jgi:hypothetical protein
MHSNGNLCSYKHAGTKINNRNSKIKLISHGFACYVKFLGFYQMQPHNLYNTLKVQASTTCLHIKDFTCTFSEVGPNFIDEDTTTE